MIQVLKKKPILKPTFPIKKIFRSIEKNQEKSKDPRTARAVLRKRILTQRIKQKEETTEKRIRLVLGTSSLLYYPEGQKGRGRRSVPRQEEV